MPKWLNARKLHRQIALGAVGFLTISVVTGLLWAYAPYLYWADGYMERKHAVHAPELTGARLSFAEVLRGIKERFGKDVVPTQVTLRTDAGLLLYEVQYRDADGKAHTVLLDATASFWRSPVMEGYSAPSPWFSPMRREDAVRFARQYVQGTPEVQEVSFLENWIHRKGKKGPAWQVRFADAGSTEIFIDPETGSILEDQDKARRFHFVIMDLHQLNFFGFKKVLTAIPGIPLLITIVTGIMMWVTPKVRKYAKNRAKQRKYKSGVLSKTSEPIED